MAQRYSIDDYFHTVDRMYPECSQIVRKLHRYYENKGLRFRTGKGLLPSVTFLSNSPRDLPLFILGVDETAAFAQVTFSLYKEYRPFDEVSCRRELLARLNQVAGMHKFVKKVEGKPWFDLQLLSAESDFQGFTDAYDWMIAEVDKQVGAADQHPAKA